MTNKEEKDFEDFLKENPISEIPEAVASVSYTLTTPSNFNIIFTMRGTSEVELLKRMNKVEEYFMANGFNHHQKAEPRRAEWETEEEPATPAQKNVLIKSGKWKDGISKSEASKIIDELSKSWRKN